MGCYWSHEHLERYHWACLYGKVSLERKLGAPRSLVSKEQRGKVWERLTAVRVSLCAALEVAEERISLHQLGMFYQRHEKHARLCLEYPDIAAVTDTVQRVQIDAYRQVLRSTALRINAYAYVTAGAAADWHRRAAAEGLIVYPLASANACLVSAYAMEKCKELFGYQSFTGSILTSVQRSWVNAYPSTDFAFWVQYGSWSQCPCCLSFFFNDEYFRNMVYRSVATSAKPCMLASVARSVPDDPVLHAGSVGISSRWWFLSGMYKPSAKCARCCVSPADQDTGSKFSDRLRARARYALASTEKDKAVTREAVSKTAELYCIPRLFAPEVQLSEEQQRITWPRYDERACTFNFSNSGESMLDLTEAEYRALQVVHLKTQVQKETYGAAHQFNWKKVGLSRAYFHKDIVDEAHLPTERARAAYRFLRQRNEY